MDQEVIGQFIAQVRKEKGLTQSQLADQLGISNRTISKWETGNGFPEVSLILPLCQALDINVNELLSGKSLSEKDYYQKAEGHMMSLLNEKEENLKKRSLAWAVFVLVIVTVVVLAFIVKSFEEQNALAYWSLLGYMLIFLFGGMGIMLFLYFDAEIYQCQHCQRRFKPTLRNYLSSPVRTLREKKFRLLGNNPWYRTLTCPHCQHFGRCTRVLTTEEGGEAYD